MKDINLLPKEKAVSGPTLKLYGYIRRLTTATLVVFLLAALTIGSFFVINAIELRDVRTRSEEYKSTIASLETVEQKFSLIRDRIGKAKGVLSKRGSFGDVANLEGILEEVGVGVTLSQTEVSNDGLKLSATVPSSELLARFMSILVSSEFYKSVSLTSFGFNPSRGYLVGIEAKNN